MYNHELTQIFYDGLGQQDRYLLDAASGGTFMSKYEDEAMELIEMVVENTHHNAAKPFKRGAMLKGQMIDAKSAETGMLLERIDKMAEVQNLLLDRLNVRNGSEVLTLISLQEGSSCANCSRFDHIELDCPALVIQAQGMFRQGPLISSNQDVNAISLLWINPTYAIILSSNIFLFPLIPILQKYRSKRGRTLERSILIFLCLYSIFSSHFHHHISFTVIFIYHLIP